MSAILETVSLTKSFGGLFAVDEVDFTLQEGDLQSIIGPNGADLTAKILPACLRRPYPIWALPLLIKSQIFFPC
jgi:ABC-type phosphonate transport system ATPase subunit